MTVLETQGLAAKRAARHIAPPAEEDGAAQFFSQHILRALREEESRPGAGGAQHGV